MDFFQILENSLPVKKLALVKSAGQIAREEGVSLYLVGGAVRDLLLGRPTDDLDLVVEGDAETLAFIIAKRLSGHVVSRSQFSTAKISVDGVSLDMVTARSEHYNRPGTLPQIAPGNIEEDLARRDFSINAMAVPLHLLGNAQLLDPFDGESDLHSRLIRVLHDKSFVDDATRIMRAVRYEQRLGFRMEEGTENLLRRDLPMLDTISGDRLRKELLLWFAEENYVETLVRADRLGVMAAIVPSLAGSSQLVESTVSDLERRCVEEQVLLGLLTYSFDSSDGEKIIGRLSMPPRWMTVIRDTIELRKKLPLLSDAVPSLSYLYESLTTLTTSAVQVCALVSTSENVRRNLTLFLDKLRYIKPSLGGKDLIEIGVPQGPAIGEMLIKLRSGRLEGTVTSRSEEEAIVKNWLAIQQT
jgi:tRNA nucleotidyltransferase (CCA-adding enzyme)